MTKFKFFQKLKQGYQTSRKCVEQIRRILMDRSDPAESQTAEKYNGAKKKIHRKRSHQKPDVYSSQSEEGFIPLAARDSKWVDLAFYNPNFKSQQEDECDEEELQIIDEDGLIQPIFLLFPGLADESKDSSNLLTNVSTSDVTKMLVGQKADFSHMRSSRKLLPPENTLKSVQEMPQEDVESINPLISSPSSSGYSEPSELQDTDEEIQRKTHVKKRKKLSDICVKDDSDDSSLLITRTVRKRSLIKPIKPKTRGNITILHDDSEVIHPSTTGSLGDDEDD
nr:uncharacterized protein LOC111423827 isoform X1 [Onthophagus taurus]